MGFHSTRLENRDDPLLDEVSGQIPASMNKEVTESGSEAVAVHQARDTDFLLILLFFIWDRILVLMVAQMGAQIG